MYKLLISLNISGTLIFGFDFGAKSRASRAWIVSTFLLAIGFSLKIIQSATMSFLYLRNLMMRNAKLLSVSI